MISVTNSLPLGRRSLVSKHQVSPVVLLQRENPDSKSQGKRKKYVLYVRTKKGFQLWRNLHLKCNKCQRFNHVRCVMPGYDEQTFTCNLCSTPVIVSPPIQSELLLLENNRPSNCIPQVSSVTFTASNDATGFKLQY